MYRRWSGWLDGGGGYKCQLSVKILAICQLSVKAWSSYVGKIPDDRGFYFLLTVPDISDNRRKSVLDSSDEFGRQKLKLA